MIIDVTQTHIDHGTAKDCEKCPVALALLENFPNAVVDVCKYEISVRPFGGEKMIFNAPFSVTEFINQFDEYAEVKPFKFNLLRRK